LAFVCLDRFTNHLFLKIFQKFRDFVAIIKTKKKGSVNKIKIFLYIELGILIFKILLILFEVLRFDVLSYCLSGRVTRYSKNRHFSLVLFNRLHPPFPLFIFMFPDFQYLQNQTTRSLFEQKVSHGFDPWRKWW
jgi:hypothetical protein